MTREQYQEAIARYEKDASDMTNRADLHRGMAEEAHYRYFAKNALDMVALMRERMEKEYPCT